MCGVVADRHCQSSPKYMASGLTHACVSKKWSAARTFSVHLLLAALPMGQNTLGSSNVDTAHSTKLAVQVLV